MLHGSSMDIIYCRCHIDIFWCYLISFGYDYFLPTTQDSFIWKVRRFAKKISNNMTSSRASKSAACQKHDFCLRKSTSIQPCASCCFSFLEKKTPWDVTGNLDLYMYIYIYIYMDFDSLFFFGRWIAVLSALGQQIDGFCWPCFNRKGLRRKGLLFVLHMIRDAVIGCHSSSGVNQAFVSNRCSITNQIFKDQYVSFPKYIRPIQCIYGKMSILWKLEIVFSYDILPIYIA